MKLTRRQLVRLSHLLPTFTATEIVEIAECIEEIHTKQTIKVMLNDGSYIEPAMRVFYDELILGGL